MNGGRGMAWNDDSNQLLSIDGDSLYSFRTNGSRTHIAQQFNVGLGLATDNMGKTYVSDQIGPLGGQTGGNLWEFTDNTVPEPSSILLAGAGLAVLAYRRTRK